MSREFKERQAVRINGFLADLSDGSAEGGDDVSQRLRPRVQRKIRDPTFHLRIDGGVRPRPDRPDLGDLDDHVTEIVSGGAPDDSPVSVADGQLSEPHQRPEQRFACVGVPLEEEQLLQHLPQDLRVEAHETSQVVHGRVDQPDVGAGPP